jgi:hypothetical protein
MDSDEGSGDQKRCWDTVRVEKCFGEAEWFFILNMECVLLLSRIAAAATHARKKNCFAQERWSFEWQREPAHDVRWFGVKSDGQNEIWCEKLARCMKEWNRNIKCPESHHRCYYGCFCLWSKGRRHRSHVVPGPLKIGAKIGITQHHEASRPVSFPLSTNLKVQKHPNICACPCATKMAQRTAYGFLTDEIRYSILKYVPRLLHGFFAHLPK